MRGLLQKHPDGLAGFAGSLEPTPRQESPPINGRIPNSSRDITTHTSVIIADDIPLEAMHDTLPIALVAGGISLPPQTPIKSLRMKSGANLAENPPTAITPYRTGPSIRLEKRRLKRAIKLPLRSNRLKRSATQLPRLQPLRKAIY